MSKLKTISQITFFFVLFACSSTSEADVDGDGVADIFVKSNHLEDAIKGDNIFLIDGVVVNAVTNQQWILDKGQLAVVEQPTFTMKFNNSTKQWEVENKR